MIVRAFLSSLLVIVFAGVTRTVAAQDMAIIDSLVTVDSTLGPIPINEIGSEAVTASTRLMAIRQDATPRGLIDRIQEEWENREPQITTLRSETRRSLERTTDPDWLLELDRRWGRSETILDDWLGVLAGRSKLLTADLLELASMERQWGATLSIARNSDLPASVIANVDTLLLEIEELEPIVQDRLNAFLELESRVSRERQIVQHTRREIDEVTASEFLSFVRRESDPVSDVLELDLSDENVRDDRSYLTLFYQSTVTYLAASTQYAWIQFGLLLVLVWLTYTLHRRVSTWNEERPGVPVDTEIFSRPFSAALLVTFLATEAIYPHASIFLVGIALIASIWPAYRLLAIMIPKELESLLRSFFTILVLVLIARFLVPEHTTVGRLIHFALTVTITIGVGFVLRSTPTTNFLMSSVEGRRIRFGLRLSFAVLAFSAFVSLFGFGPLSRHLMTSAVYSAYFILLIYIGSLVVRAMFLGFLKSPFAHRSRVIKNHFPEIATRTTRIINFVAFLAGIQALLDTFGVYRLFYNWISDLLTAPIRAGEAEISIGGVLIFLLTFWIALLLAKFIRFLLEEEFLTRVRMGRGKPQAISGTLYYILITLGFIFALSATGMPMDRLTVLAGAFGVGLGFGLQDVVNNFVSGLILLYESPIQVGDTIEFGTNMGTVKRIGIRSSVVRTFEGAEVNVPNSHLVSNDVTNWTMSDTRRRLTIPFGVAYGTDTSVIPDLIMAIASDHPDIDRDPEPMLLFVAMGDSSLNFELRCWTSSGDWLQIKSDLTDSVYAKLGDAGIEIPFPQRDLHIRSVDEQIRGMKAPDD